MLDPRVKNSPIDAHKHSSNHRGELLNSDQCGCFYCGAIYPPINIAKWVDEIDGIGTTAICPYCGIDSVIGALSGYPITVEFMNSMKKHWF
jgi:hypothetical protein